MDWHAEMFDDLNEEWDELVGLMDATSAASFVSNLAREVPPGIILDLGCGQGRLLRPLSETGRCVVGVDRSRQQLARAAAQVSGDANIALVEADMRQLPFGELVPTLSIAVRCYTSLGYFTREEEGEILRSLRAHTHTGGAVVVDTINWRWVRDSSPIERTTLARNVQLTETYTADVDKRVIESVWRYDFSDSRPSHSIAFELDGYDASDVAHLLAGSGWGEIKVYRGYSSEMAGVDDEDQPERLVGVGRA